MNDMLDQPEAYLREESTSFRLHIDGQHFRKAFPTGLRGGFKRGLGSHNVLLEGMADRQMAQMRNPLISQVHRLNTGNLLANLSSNQADLKRITDEMREVVVLATCTTVDAEESPGAVVADEVRKLAEDTCSASESIGRVMETVSAEAQHMLDDSHAMRDMAAASRGVIGGMEGRFADFARSTRETQDAPRAPDT